MTGDDQHPIFLGGVAGTGKTRLGTVLGRHPRISATRRTYLWRTCHGRFGDLGDPRQRERLVDSIVAIPGVAALDLPPGAIRDRVLGIEPLTYALAFGAVHQLRAEQVGKPRWCDQLGLVELYAEPIFAQWPGATIVHLVADPRFRVSTRRPGWFGWDLGKWMTSAQRAEANRRRHGDRYLVVRHEDLLADEEATIRQICASIAEDFEPAMVAGAGSTPAPAAPHDPEWVERVCGPLLGQLGYGSVPGPRRTGLRTRIVDRPGNIAGLAAWQRWRAPAIDRLTLAVP